MTRITIDEFFNSPEKYELDSLKYYRLILAESKARGIPNYLERYPNTTPNHTGSGAVLYLSKSGGVHYTGSDEHPHTPNAELTAKTIVWEV